MLYEVITEWSDDAQPGGEDVADALALSSQDLPGPLRGDEAANHAHAYNFV